MDGNSSLTDLQLREALKAARRNAEQLRITLNCIGDAVIATDEMGLVSMMNPVAENLTGWTAAEGIGKHLHVILHIINAKTREPATNPLDLVLKSGKTVGLANHTVLISKKGTEYQIADSAAPIIDNEGRISGVVLVFRDVTEKYRLEEALEKRLVALTQPLEGGSITFEDLFNLAEIQRIQDEFANATGVASIITRPDGTPITQPSNFTRLCSEIIRKTGKGCANCFHSDAAIGRYHPTGPIVQPCLSGSLWDAGASISVGGHHIANWLIGQVRDETQTEEKMLAYAREIGADEKSFLEAFRNVPAMTHEHFEEIAQALFTLANQLSSVVYQNVQQARFIAERQQVEKALKESEYFLRESQAVARLGSYVLDIPTGLWKSSAVLDEIFGIDEHYERSVKGWTMLAHPEWQQVMADYFVNHVLGQHARFDKDYQIIRPNDGEVRWVHGMGELEFDDQQQPVKMIGTIQDITERKRVETELQKMQKLTSVGTLAGGIAHDFNNILMGLFGNISLAKTEIPKDHPGFKPLEDAEKSMFRAIRLTKQLLTFAKGGDPVKEEVSLDALVEEVARFDLSGSNVMLVHSQTDDLWSANVDKGQIQQVISNLTLNAREAMPNGGHLYVSLENVEIKESSCSGPNKGKYIKITMRDEGTGIDQKIIDRIFDPYFTTKHTGSGLGLATSYSIIFKHGGHIGVTSEMGQGATFTLYLPASESQIFSENKKTHAPPSPLKSSLKFLILDDEEVIRMIVPRWLKRMGCFVATSADGRETIDMYRKSLSTGEPFDILILDLTIPGGIGGLEVVKEILAIDPKTKAIVSSGYANDPVMSNYAFYGFKGVLPKPYTESQLQELVGQIAHH